jgi:hypothetical protein
MIPVLTPMSDSRLGPAPETVIQQLGPLGDLAGTWIGNGFSLVALPDRKFNPPFRLQLNATKEVLTFTPVGAPIPDHGSEQGDISFVGLHYFQQVSDAETSSALHLEPGIWLPIPRTEAPKLPKTIVRLSTIPHGTSLLSQGGEVKCRKCAPQIEAVDPIPFVFDSMGNRQDVTDPQYLFPYLYGKTPHGIPGCASTNPNLVLVRDLQRLAERKQKIVHTGTLSVSANPICDIEILQPANQRALEKLNALGGLLNIPFLVANAKAVSFAATFWLETVLTTAPTGCEDGDDEGADANRTGSGTSNSDNPNAVNENLRGAASSDDGSSDCTDLDKPDADRTWLNQFRSRHPYFVQLQYSQTTFLDFGDILWPHVAVGTLVRQ